MFWVVPSHEIVTRPEVAPEQFRKIAADLVLRIIKSRRQNKGRRRQGDSHGQDGEQFGREIRGPEDIAKLQLAALSDGWRANKKEKGWG